MPDSTITPASPVQVPSVGVAVSAEASSIRATAERDVAAARKYISTAVSFDVVKVESLWSRVKPYLPILAVGYALGFTVGRFVH